MSNDKTVEDIAEEAAEIVKRYKLQHTLTDEDDGGCTDSSVCPEQIGEEISEAISKLGGGNEGD